MAGERLAQRRQNRIEGECARRIDGFRAELAVFLDAGMLVDASAARKARCNAVTAFLMPILTAASKSFAASGAGSRPRPKRSHQSRR